MVEYDAFASLYDVQMGHLTMDLDFYVDLACHAEPPVLELAVGTGRVALPIARAGVPIVGLDHSSEMLAVARAKLEQEPGLPLRLLQADMRDFALDETFGLVIIPFRAFLHLTTPQEQIACLTAIHKHLRPGGRLALNFFVPDIELIAAYRGKLGRVINLMDTITSPASGNRVEIWQHRSYDPHRQFIDQCMVYQEWSEDGVLLSTVKRSYTLCYIWPREFEHLLARCGLAVEALYGGFDGRPLDENSVEQVWLARK